MSAGWSVAIGFAGVVLGAVVGFALTEVGGYLRRQRETQSSALLVFQELTTAYIAAEQIVNELVRKPEDLFVRREAWHRLSIVRALSIEESHLLAKAYARIDDLPLLLRSGVVGQGEREWWETNVFADIHAAAVVVARLAGQPLSDVYGDVVVPRLPQWRSS